MRVLMTYTLAGTKREVCGDDGLGDPFRSMVDKVKEEGKETDSKKWRSILYFNGGV